MRDATGPAFTAWHTEPRSFLVSLNLLLGVRDCRKLNDTQRQTTLTLGPRFASCSASGKMSNKPLGVGDVVTVGSRKYAVCSFYDRFLLVLHDGKRDAAALSRRPRSNRLMNIGLRWTEPTCHFTMADLCGITGSVISSNAGYCENRACSRIYTDSSVFGVWFSSKDVFDDEDLPFSWVSSKSRGSNAYAEVGTSPWSVQVFDGTVGEPVAWDQRYWIGNITKDGTFNALHAVGSSHLNVAYRTDNDRQEKHAWCVCPTDDYFRSSDCPGPLMRDPLVLRPHGYTKRLMNLHDNEGGNDYRLSSSHVDDWTVYFCGV